MIFANVPNCFIIILSLIFGDSGMSYLTVKNQFNKEYLSECLVYGKHSGRFTWLKRPREHFNSLAHFNTWNSKNEGEDACLIDPNGYQSIQLDGVTLKAHHVAFILVEGFKPDEVDHEDGNRSNNSWGNIRSVTRIENTINRKLRSDNSSGVHGVSQRKDNGKWRASINVNKKKIRLGDFATKDEAINARLEAEKEYGYHQNHGRKA